MDSAPRTAAALGIDFGTHHTVATVLRDDGRRHQLLFEGTPLLPSGIYLDNEASISVGRDAAREGRRHPERYERNPKLRLDVPTILLGDKEIPVREAVAAVLRRVIADCGTVAGVPRSVTVTVPAGWGPARRHVIGDAAAGAGAVSPVLLPEPVAAARYFADVLGRELAPGQTLVVFDLGAGTFDASAVARTGTGYDVLAVDGSDRIGGHYFDQALVEYLGGRFAGSEERAEQWAGLLDPDAGPERRRQRFALYDEVREAKERLSRRTSTEIAVPGFAVDEMLTRAELELLARPLLTQAVAITRAVIREAGLEPEQLAGLFMVGGASRMPLAATMIHQELGIAPTLIEQPELVVSEGAVAIHAAPTPTPAAPLPPVTPAAPYTPVPQVPVAPSVLTPASDPAAVQGPPTAPLSGFVPQPPAPQPDRRSPRPFTVFVIALLVAVLTGAVLAELMSRDGDGTGGEDPTGASGEGTRIEPESDAAQSDTALPAWPGEVTEVVSGVATLTITTDADPDSTGCRVDFTGSSSQGSVEDLSCAEFTLEGLNASDTYFYSIHSPQEGSEPVTGVADTAVVTGTVQWDCPQSRTYCRNQGGSPGIRGTPESSAAVDYADVGEQFELACYTAAEVIDPRGEEAGEGFWDYHPGKDASDLMIEVELSEGRGYIPFVWLVIDPADLNSVGGLAAC
ncbi:Hsp70 family protein [Glycomyces tritici]|uniref:Hsp70 family protein n=1 Tax=Glycomyces tritici TaxID=2665176 RepID=A0ABT7YL38_9ACTN|nr:Hsp70 family protein [Glycomyces tritici]MDN3239352.1 Hsp70 family protein [Glycomyces tritici]